MKKYCIVCFIPLLVITDGFGQKLGRDTLYLFSCQIERRFEKDKANQQATAFSFIGDCQNAHVYFDKTNGLPGKMNREDSIRFRQMKPVSARDYIVARSKTEQNRL